MPSETDPMLSPAEARDLRRIAGIMIPPDAALGVPGADDDLILADIAHSLGRDAGDVRTAIVELAELAGGRFADLDADRADTVAQAFLDASSAAGVVLGRVILQCYYRDDRVLLSLGMEPRPPFPKGHTVEQGDWSLLDPVRRRPKLWRDDRIAPNG